jgi:hypothetical protein
MLLKVSKMNIGLNPNCKILINECWTKSSYNRLKLYSAHGLIKKSWDFNPG